jgi:glycosyltransferase involved in cell wall biosynthesis
VERYTYNLSKTLVAKGFEVIVVTTHIPGLPEYELVEGVRIYRIPSLRLLNGRFPFVLPRFYWKKLSKKFSTEPIDAMIIQTHLYTLSAWGAKYAAKQSLPIITIEHGSGHSSLGNTLVDFFGRLYEHAMVFRIKRFCSDFYAVSQKSASWLEHYKIAAKGVLYNAVDLKGMEQLTNEKEFDFKEAYNIPEQDVLIAFVSRLVKGKGLLELVAAVNALNAQGNHLRLFIAGDGELYQTVLSQQSDRVIVLGQLSHAEVISLFYQSDIYCLPTSLTEGFPTTVLEAAATKCFCITTSMGGSQELISGKELGIILPNTSQEALMKALDDTLEHPEYRQSAIEASYRKVCNQFTWDTTTRNLLAVFGFLEEESLS